ncbi:hypothetical protein [Moorena sp. SIO3A5]|uniref:hypothetical protein n=1 Tax=Moorena sp. SIO3A5 TaxID=2607822 RepID=UPI00141D57D8|nr:hypothetical protein [Moorena sp. SIO3A5]NEP68991.1 hypothetical protein [Moorena sp. SIO3A5]
MKMLENANPFIRLGDDGENAPRLNYSIPESTNYVGTSVISIDIEQELLNKETIKVIKENREKKKKKRPIATLDDLKLKGVKVVNRADNIASVSNQKDVKEIFQVNPSGFIYKPREDMFGFAGGFDVIRPRPIPDEKISPKILFFEKLQISNFLGNYGAGRVIKTFSLFPGEKTKISIKTYQKIIETETQKRNVGSSILDSVTEEAAIDFENSIASESSSKYEESESDILNSQRDYSKSEGEGSASVLWGLVDAGGKGGSEKETSIEGEWGTRSAREEFAKTVSNALFKHSSRASSKRDVEINTSSEVSSEVSTETGQEKSIERVIENVNVSRTLNLVFRQMVQEYISILHLVDVKIALYDESIGPYPQYSIHELDKFLYAYFLEDEESRAIVKNGIIRELYYIFNYLDEPKQFLEKVSLEFPVDNIEDLDIELPEKIEYLRVRKDMKEKLVDKEFIEIQGVILKENIITMRTEGVVVDAFLGQGEALDIYSQGLQTETVRELNLKNSLQEQMIYKMDIARRIIEENDMQKAEIFEKVYPCCRDEMKNISIYQSDENNQEENG